MKYFTIQPIKDQHFTVGVLGHFTARLLPAGWKHPRFCKVAIWEEMRSFFRDFVGNPYSTYKNRNGNVIFSILQYVQAFMTNIVLNGLNVRNMGNQEPGSYLPILTR